MNRTHFSEYKTSTYIFCIYSNSLADHGLYGYTDVPKYSGDSITITGRGSIGHAEYRPFDFDAIIRLLVLIPKDKDIIDSRYVTELINSYVKFPLESTGVPQLTVPQIENIEISLPAIEVQRKIANALSDVDGMISSLEKLIAKYKSIKTACLQQMFPQNGETVPRMRLPGFTDAWEQRKVGELTVESSEYTTLEAGFPLLTSSRNGLMYQNEYRGKQTTDSTETMFSIVPLGACTYRHMSDDDVFHLNVNRLEKGLVSREYPVFYASDDNNLDFIVQQINSSAEFRSFCAEQKKGGTRTRLYYKNLCEFQMLIPNTEEQEKIATFLLTLDTLITLHQRKLEKIQKIKQGMMQQLLTGKIRLV